MLKGLLQWMGIVGLMLGSFAAAKQVLPPSPDVTQNLETLKTLMPALQTAETDLTNLRNELKKATTDEIKEEFNKRIASQIEKVDQLRRNFRIVATGVEERNYALDTSPLANFDTEFKDLMRPLINELRQATAKPREMEELRAAQQLWNDRLALATAALDRIKPALAVADDEEVKRELIGADKLWTSRRDEATSQTQTFAHQIEEREKNNPSVIGVISKLFAGFWRSRGLSLLMALGVSIVVYFLASRIYRLARRISPVHRRKKDGFVARSADLIATGFSILLAVISIVMVLYMRGDWLLLALSIVVVIGVIWASKAALPPYIGQIKTILNLGPVKQGERILYAGVPWKVDALNMECEFSNPELTAGVLRLPVAEVMKLNSRPADAKEPWFPTKIDDWVRLDDGCTGKVIQQTPEQVIVLQLGGSRKTYAVGEFLKKNPENLSKGYRVGVTFAIAPVPLDVALEKVPKEMKETIYTGLVEAYERETVRSVKVEFSNAGISSLAYAVIADLDGAVASKARAVERLIQKLCMAACLEQGWEIALPVTPANPPR